jgi:hypothetical protein
VPGILVIRCAFSHCWRGSGGATRHYRPSNALGRYQSFVAAVESGQRFDVVEFLDLPKRSASIHEALVNVCVKRSQRRCIEQSCAQT